MSIAFLQGLLEPFGSINPSSDRRFFSIFQVFIPYRMQSEKPKPKEALLSNLFLTDSCHLPDWRYSRFHRFSQGLGL